MRGKDVQNICGFCTHLKRSSCFCLPSDPPDPAPSPFITSMLGDTINTTCWSCPIPGCACVFKVCMDACVEEMSVTRN